MIHDLENQINQERTIKTIEVKTLLYLKKISDNLYVKGYKGDKGDKNKFEKQLKGLEEDKHFSCENHSNVEGKIDQFETCKELKEESNKAHTHHKTFSFKVNNQDNIKLKNRSASCIKNLCKEPSINSESWNKENLNNRLKYSLSFNKQKVERNWGLTRRCRSSFDSNFIIILF